MNKSEQIAYQWLLEQGYSADQITFRSHTSPDFLTTDCRGWEVKQLINGAVLFNPGQYEALRHNPRAEILVCDDAKLYARIPSSALTDALPVEWGGIRVEVIEATQHRLISYITEEEYSQLRQLAVDLNIKSVSALAGCYIRQGMREDRRSLDRVNAKEEVKC